MNEQNGREFLQALYNEVWCAKTPDKIEKFYSKNLSGFVDQNPVVFEDIRTSYNFIVENCKEFGFTIADVVAENNKIFGVINLKGVPKVGDPWFASTALCVELVEGKVAKMRLFSSSIETMAAQNAGLPEGIA
jgi:hypothetical protein